MTSQNAQPRPPDRRYPAAPRLPVVDEVHGRRVPDPYRWLENAGDPQTESWSTAQDVLVAAQVTELPGRVHFHGRVGELLGSGSVSAPAWRADRQFFIRRTPEQQHAVVMTVDPDGTERTLIDPMVIDPSGTTTLDSWQPSKEGLLLAYQLSEGGTEESVLRVLDVATGAVVDGPIDRARYSPVAWLPGGEAFYYVRRLAPDNVPADEQQYHRRVWLHQLGADPDSDVEIFGAGREMTTYYGVSVSMDGRWLTVSASEGTAPRNDLWLADLKATSAAVPQLRVVQDHVDAQTGLHVGRDGRLYVFTDREAPRGRIAVTSPETPDHSAWTDLVAQDPEAVLEGFALLDGDELGDAPVLLCTWTRHAVSEITIHDLASGARTGSVPLPGLGAIGGVSERPEGGHEGWFGYTDNVTPGSVYHFDARTGSTKLWATPPGSVVVPTVHTAHVEYVSRDGTTVRMFVISPVAAPDHPRPTVLYGYGGFGVPLTPGYSATVLAWVEAGGVYAVANLRGGTEEGETWHRDGMREHKQNVFDDFIAAGERLIADGWTTAQHLSISGGSNGGLLVGAVMTQRPDLFAAVVCSAPLLDMVRYEQFGLGATWSDEFGTAGDPDEFGWLFAYSPYHHVRDGVDYPATLFTVFDSDTRVDPMHARKMCAALQAATSSSRPVLIRREKDVGHGGRSLSRTVDLAADTLAFAAHWTGLEVPG